MTRYLRIFLVAALLLTGLSYWAQRITAQNDLFMDTVREDEEKDAEPLTLEEFIRLATENDTEFESILIDELTLHYSKSLGLPPGDLILAVKSEYDLFLHQDRGDINGEISLSKLFPFLGTTVSAAYETVPSFAKRENSTEMTALISQPIAENAFGRATRIRDKIIGLEIDIAKHQIVEAYEDFFAAIISAYYDWYEAYENLKIGESSYRANVKLRENMQERMKSNIALPIDVNKIKLQVYAKEENLISLKTKYANSLNFIEKTIRHTGAKKLVPVEPRVYANMDISFDENYANFEKTGRTHQILDLLETRGEYLVKEDFDDLLPSIELFSGYTFQWMGRGIEREDNMFFAGVKMQWPVPDTVEQAEYQVSKINRKKATLATVNTHYRLFVDLKNLYQQIKREQELIAIAADKIVLAEAVLKDETENYSFGKVSLNDYIDAVNVYDNNRFNKVQHDVLMRRLKIEWLRLSDRLITRDQIRSYEP